MRRSAGRATIRDRVGFLLVALTLALPIAPLSAQTVSGTIREEGSTQPVSAALVELLRPDSSVAAAALSGSNGTYRIAASLPGSYLVRVRRIGYATAVRGPITLDDPEVLDLELRTEPIALDGISASASPRCETEAGIGPETHRLWTLISNALEITRLAQDQELFEFDMHRFVRDLDTDRRHILLEGVDRLSSSRPFEAVDMDRLEDQGYVDAHPRGLFSYYMPDAAVLVSDDFLDSHCFTVVEGDVPGTVGLGFFPVDDRSDDRPRSTTRDYEELFGRRVVEVSGVLWVDQETGALIEMEVDYEGFERSEFERHARGYARFAQVGGGFWIVRQWWLRMPNLNVGSDDKLAVESVREAGGFVVGVETADGLDALPTRNGGSVSGRIVPADLPIQLSGALVRLSGSPAATRADSTGHFRFTDVPPGPYLLTWWAPGLDSLGVATPATAVSVVGGVERRVDLAVPARQTVLDELCAGMRADPGLGVLRVEVTSPSGRLPVNQPVRIHSLDADRELERVNVVRDDVAIFCSVPTGMKIGVTAPPWAASGTVTLGPGDIRLLELEIDRTRRR